MTTAYFYIWRFQCQVIIEMETNPELEQFLKELQEIHEEHERVAENPPAKRENGDPDAQPFMPGLKWHERIRPKSNIKYRTVEQVRQELPERLNTYYNATFEDPSLLLVQVEAGVGKSHAGVNFLQAKAGEEGVRGLWLGQAHRMFESLSIYPDFNPEQWLHWQSINEHTCLYNPAMQQWTDKGYPSIRLCVSLCHASGHMANGCVFRRQVHSPKPIVFGMHQHLIFGLPRDDFQIAIIDENPLQVFIQERIIPPHGILSDGYGIASVKGLYETLHRLTQTGKCYRAKALLDEIAVDLGRVYRDIKNVAKMKVILPTVYQSSDVDRAPYWFLKDLLLLLIRELKCYDDGWEDWNSRVQVDSRGLHLHSRSDEWGGLPDKLIVFDATGEAEIYHQLFPNRLIEVYNPQIKRKGEVIGIVGKHNGKGTLLDKDGEPSYNWEQIALQCEEMAKEGGYKRAGVVCLMNGREPFERIFGKENVLHFYNQRGTNQLESCDIIFVVGTPSPDSETIVRMATALDRDRMVIFNHHQDFIRSERFYNLTTKGAIALGHAGEMPSRLLGDYSDPLMKALLHQLREKEIWQAVHRIRLVNNAAKVVIFSPAIDEKLELDAIHNIPPLAPEGIGLDNWLKIKRWLPTEAREGRAVGRQELAKAIGVQETTITSRNWLGIIQGKFVDSRGLPMWAFEDDPNYAGKRGRRIQRLKPVEY